MTEAVHNDSMVHYQGRIGDFWYDPNEFRFVENQTHMGGLRERFAYIGNETDGRNINIPDGILDCIGMFEKNQQLETPPRIPSSVKNCAAIVCMLYKFERSAGDSRWRGCL